LAEAPGTVVFETRDRRLAEFVRHALSSLGVACEMSGHTKCFLPNQLRDAQWEIRVAPDDSSRSLGLVARAVEQFGRVKSLERPPRPNQADKDPTDRSFSSGEGTWFDLDSDGGD
jgi:hypothetical protein